MFLIMMWKSIIKLQKEISKDGAYWNECMTTLQLTILVCQRYSKGHLGTKQGKLETLIFQ